jgi:two-component system, chemotaxis family, sensor kinase CheA
MNPDFSPELQAELLDDFYAEADEHLGNIRTQLGVLEGAGFSAPDPVAIESIYRSAHSFKGISAMVGLRSAEQLAHSAEDYLRSLTRQLLRLTPQGMDVLVATSNGSSRL